MSQFSQLDHSTQKAIRRAIEVAKLTTSLSKFRADRSTVYAQPVNGKIVWRVSVEGMDVAQGTVTR